LFHFHFIGIQVEKLQIEKIILEIVFRTFITFLVNVSQKHTWNEKKALKFLFELTETDCNKNILVKSCEGRKVIDSKKVVVLQNLDLNF
jgi:hypothetical protein